MEPYEKVIIRLLPGETPREKFLFLQKTAEILIRVKNSAMTHTQKNNLINHHFREEDLQKIVKG